MVWNDGCCCGCAGISILAYRACVFISVAAFDFSFMNSFRVFCISCGILVHDIACEFGDVRLKVGKWLPRHGIDLKVFHLRPTAVSRHKAGSGNLRLA